MWVSQILLTGAFFGQGVALVTCTLFCRELVILTPLILFPISPNDLLPFVLEVPIDHSDLVADLLKELSNHNERVEERKGALLELLKITREDNLGVWEEHFKTILLLLLETLGDKDVRCRFFFFSFCLTSLYVTSPGVTVPPH